jgi:putative transposase
LPRLEEFEAEWGKRYPAIGQAWRRAWEYVVPFFALKLLYPAIRNAGLRWRRTVDWTAAMGQFSIQFGERFPGAAR